MYGIMRTGKRSRNDVYGIQIEANRTQEDHLRDREFNGSNIDWSLTERNIYLLPKNDNWNKTITDTLEQYNIKPRKNSVVLLDSIYTASADFFEGKTHSEFIFADRNGNHFKRQRINDRLYSYYEKANVIKKSTHKIRRCVVSTLLDNVKNKDSVRMFAGHENIQTTFNAYYKDISSDEGFFKEMCACL